MLPLLRVRARQSFRLQSLSGRHIIRGMQTLPPPLYQQQEDGSEKPATEDDFFQYSRYRWLANDARNRAARYRKFNVSALQQAAVHAAGPGATSCSKMVKCIEGQYNKVFVLTMNNGDELIAKLPNPNAGPAVYTTASEVATCRFLRDVLHVPVPRIYSYSTDPSGPVGAEYIVQEKAKGVPLGSVWHQWSFDLRRQLVKQVVDLEERLASVSFDQHGCFYFKKTLERLRNTGHSSTSTQGVNEFNSDCESPLLKEFQFGPLTSSELWENERAGLEMDRGPWANHHDYMMALGRNELLWAKKYAKPRMNYYRSRDVPENPEEYILLLEKYLQLIPLIAPLLSNGSAPKSLAHPDLHLDNIFVDKETAQICDVIDWQSATIAEPFFQSRTPRLIMGAGSSDTGHLQSDMTKHDESNHAAHLIAYYHQLSKDRNPSKYQIRSSNMRSLLTKPSSLVTGAWTRRNVALFRHSLIGVLARWKELFPDDIPCPITFTDEELEIHAVEMDNMTGIGEALQNLDSSNQIPLGGMVPREHYEGACRINDHMKKVFLELAEDDAQRIWFSRLWPYQDENILEA